MWLDRANNFHCLCEEVNECFNRLTAIPNRPLLYDLYQYMSDARETTLLLDSYVSWLGTVKDEITLHVAFVTSHNFKYCLSVNFRKAIVVHHRFDVLANVSKLC